MSKIIPSKIKNPSRHRSDVSECNISDCMHFDVERWRCSLRKCFYDRENVISELDTLEYKRKRGSEEWN